MKIEKKLWISLIAFGLFGIIFSGWIFHQSTIRERLLFDTTTSLETTSLTEDEIKTESIVLPEEFSTSKSLLFHTGHTKVEIWLDGRKLYQYGEEKNVPKFMKSPGSCWHIVDVPEDSAGKNLQIKLIPVYSDYYGNAFNLYIGTKGDCILKILSNSLGTLIISCGILFAGIISLILYFASHKKKLEMNLEGNPEIFLNLGLFALLIAIWSLQQCGFLQFLIPDGRTLYYIDFFTFFLFPVPFNFLLYDICKSKYHKGALYLSAMYLLNMAVAVLLQCTGIVDIFQILPVTHVIMLVNAVYTVVLIHYEAIKLGNESARDFRYPMYLIMFFGIVELIVYYLQKFQQTSIFLTLGTILFIILLIWIQVSRYYDHYVERQRLDYLQKMANTDMLTNAQNRNAYENRIQSLNEHGDELLKTGIVLFDLDNLKVINDHFGHEKGDEALKLCCQCIRQAFPEEVNCFRIGGDEFAYLYQKEEHHLIEGWIEQLNNLLKKTDRSLPYSLSVSTGYACFLPDTDISFRDMVKRSDIMLYHIKRKKKISRAVSLEIPHSSTLSDGKDSAITEVSEEIVSHATDYQNLSPQKLCNVIDLLSSSTDGYLYLIDFRTDFYYIAPQSMDRFCLPDNEFHNVMETHKSFVYKKDYPLLRAEFDELLHTDRCNHNMDYRWLDRNHKPVWINCRGHLVRDNQKKPLYMIGCINEIGEKQRADNITGLYGETVLKNYFTDDNASPKTGVLLHIGIDHFKTINEKFGWDYGDFILRETAACISSCLMENQTVYKVAADEFIILDVSSDNVQTASRLYEQIQKTIHHFIEDNHFTVVFTVSAGILPFHVHSKNDYTELIKRSDFSLNEAKSRGRNRYYLFNEKEYQDFLRIRIITDELHSSVNHGFEGFTAFYQPLLNVTQNRLAGAEALMRFTSETFGPVSPAEFIPILEESGLILLAGRWIMQESIKTCKKIREKLPFFKISVNVSQIQIAKSDVIGDFITELEKAGLSADGLIIELTESALLEKGINEKDFIQNLKNAGLQLALDDFGTGYSNFHYLNELHPEIVKIDRSFTAQAIADEKEYQLLNQFCNMVHNLDLKICIEGVENSDEWDLIKLLKPDFCQGFFWGKPCPYEDFKRMFVDNETTVSVK